MQKFHGDLTVSLKVISEKQCYAVMKYIVDELIYNFVYNHIIPDFDNLIIFELFRIHTHLEFQNSHLEFALKN